MDNRAVSSPAISRSLHPVSCAFERISRCHHTNRPSSAAQHSVRWAAQRLRMARPGDADHIFARGMDRSVPLRSITWFRATAPGAGLLWGLAFAFLLCSPARRHYAKIRLTKPVGNAGPGAFRISRSSIGYVAASSARRLGCYSVPFSQASNVGRPAI